MNYIFFGSPRFAEIILQKLLDAGFPPAALVCNPDQPVGRKKILTAPATKELVTKAEGTGPEAKIQILQPEKLDAELVETLKSLRPDFFVVAAYAKIIPKAVLEIPRLGAIGVHPSLLPKLRGASPIQSAILNGEKETGVTLYLMDEKMDHGPMLATRTLGTANGPWPMAKTAYPELHDALANLGAELLAEILPEFMEGKITPQPQDEAQATFTRKFTTQDGFISPEDLEAAARGDAEKTAMADRRIRGLNPDPGVWTIRDGKRIKLLEAEVTNGTLRLRKIQKEGEKPKEVK
ncbi:MAG: methionyl-tRNA formyltransferase [Patescibacteria group bacterium]|nr:methionyl-tRNA formyltransferase [Patescibacteria group bacterium]